ncbi:MAG TPA: aldo/keto reductase [Candidatus Nitrosocosmicus sp.]|nr:aldo/keto reductase [Candidatus Nitrosocosmicus sp.]
MSFQRKFYSGFASPKGTTKYMDNAILKGVSKFHFKTIENLKLSSVGMGTYLGNLSSQDDADLEKSLYYSIMEGGINVIDTSINYRSMLSEKCIGRVISKLIEDGVIDRESVFICTKNGYVTNDGDLRKLDIDAYLKLMFLDNNIVARSDISPSYNIMNPNYISRCLDKSLCNLGLNTIDLIYIHNSFESWYNTVDRSTYHEMLSRVFQLYEDFRQKGKINFYGMATWNCFTSNENSKGYLSLKEVIKIANDVGGGNNGFKFIQLPFNLYLSDPYTFRNQPTETSNKVTLLQAAQKYGIHVFTSVPLYQGKLLNVELDSSPLDKLPAMSLKLLQLVRSTPGIVGPLIGQKKMAHTKENTSISKYPPLNELEFKAVTTMLRHPDK